MNTRRQPIFSFAEIDEATRLPHLSAEQSRRIAKAMCDVNEANEIGDDVTFAKATAELRRVGQELDARAEMHKAQRAPIPLEKWLGQ